MGRRILMTGKDAKYILLTGDNAEFVEVTVGDKTYERATDKD